MTFVNQLDHEVLTKRLRPRDEDFRGAYFRDTTAIIHSYPFRRLRHKTQVFFSPKNDHICTRMEHVLHVSTIAATICRALDLNGDLAWAIGLGHDLGHTPFGHAGERVIDEMMTEQGGFRHEMYSLRVVDHIINYGKGLNLTYAVRDGIQNHCGEIFDKSVKPDFREKDLPAISTRDFYPSTWEGVSVRVADKIAYLGRDMEDAVQLKLIRKEDVPAPILRGLGKNNSEIINTLVSDVIITSKETGEIGFSPDIFTLLIEMKEFNYENIYLSPVVERYHQYFRRILFALKDYLDGIFQKFGFDQKGYETEGNRLAHRFGDFTGKMQSFYDRVDKTYDMIVIDYLAGMTDDYAIECVKQIMIPERFESHFEEF